MKNLLIILAILLLSGCSANWHLRKALEKDPEIIDVKTDTVMSLDIRYEDSVVHYKDTIEFNHTTDTAYKNSVIFKENKPSFDTIRAKSKDGIAHAEVSMYEGKLHFKTWANIDTILFWKDSIKIKNKIIIRQQKIIEQREATITEKNSFIDKIKIVLYFIIGLFLLYIIYKIVT